MDISDLHQTFFDEADELLDDMERLLLNLDPSEASRDDLDAIFRAAHSIKGGAGTFGFSILQETTHLAENFLDLVRNGEVTLDQPTVDQLLKTRDELKDQLSAYRAEEEPDQAAYEETCRILKQMVDGHSSAVENASESVKADGPGSGADVDGQADTTTQALGNRLLTIRIERVPEKEHAVLADELALFGEVKSRESDGETLTVSLDSAEPESDIESVLCFVVDADQIHIGAAQPGTPEPAPQASPGQPSETATKESSDSKGLSAPGQNKPAAGSADQPAKSHKRNQKGNESSTLRVATDKIDTIINLVGELVITQSMLEQTTSNLDSSVADALAEGMSQLQRNARDLQEAVMSVRMMPMDYAFNRFPRLVRDLGHSLGKDVDLETRGASTELDKGLIEQIMDPLTHLVRNSLDHGIETPDAREAVGKPRAGTLTLEAQHQGGNILIEIRDDGAGLDREKLLEKAREKGLPVSDGMSDDEVWQLIFAPGFSTAAQVSDVSGRGVGMDVVKRNIQQLGGHIDLRSETGRGTAVCIALPLTLAIMEGMSVRVGSEVFILPLGAVMESMRAGDEQVKPVNGKERVLYVRGEYLALVELHRFFDIPNAQTDLKKGIVVVAQSEGRSFALFVDELLGQQQVVVKNLETHFRKIDGVSAATILGDGSVALILDVIALSRSSRERKPIALKSGAARITADETQQEALS